MNLPKVFMVLYNYSDRDYSIVKIFSSLDSAFNYITMQEDDYSDFELVHISDGGAIPTVSANDDFLKICYFKNKDYLYNKMCENDIVSDYIIASMEVC